MKKIKPEYDNMFDTTFYDIAGILSPIFRYFKFTPNMITYMNIISSLICIYYLYNKNYKLGALFIILTYLLDCCDGYYARKYNEETYFGDLLDHYSDYIYYICVYYILLVKIEWKNKIIFTILLIGLTILSILHLGCTEHYYVYKKNTNIQANWKVLCPNKETIHITKYFGPGTVIIFISLCILFYTK